MKPRRQLVADRITNLPADVIERILVFLPIRDAAKTSILSKQWRYQWRRIPHLVFDNGFGRIPYGDVSESRMKSKLMLFNIYKALLVHDGPITKFVLSIYELISCNDEIDLIILYLSNKGIQHFAFQSFRVGYVIQMHSSLFSYRHLKYLRLDYCVFTPPTWFAGFSNLTHLQLECVTLPNDFFENFLPKCPMLGYLRLEYCSGLRKLDIMAPVLKSFTIHSSYSLDICFKCTPMLSYVTLHLYSGKTPDIVSLFASLPALQQFTVQCEFLRLTLADKNVPTRLPTLHHLKVLDMYSFTLGCPVMEHMFPCLIMSSPNLHKLRIRMNNDTRDDLPEQRDEASFVRRLVEAQDCPGSSNCLQHLKEFQIDYFHDMLFDSIPPIVEPELVRFVLATAPLLQRVQIVPHSGFVDDSALEFMNKVIGYNRVSREVEVVYELNQEHLHDGFLE